MWSRVSLLALILQAAVALLLRKKDCPLPCIPIDSCPELIKLIQTNVRAVQEATCGFQQDSTPLVCCPASPQTSFHLRSASSSTNSTTTNNKPLISTTSTTSTSTTTSSKPLIFTTSIPSTTTTTTSKPLISTTSIHSTTTTTASKPPISSTTATIRELSSKNPLLPQMCNEHYSYHSPTFFPSLLLDHRVHGGQPLLHPSHYPWMAALGFRNAFTDKIDFLCGGSVINERYILTAAHCFQRQLVVVRLGEYDLSTEIDCEISPTGFVFCASEPAQDFDFEEIIEHPEFGKRGLFSDDIALVRLASPITFRQGIQPVCLASRDIDVSGVQTGDLHGSVTGWGFTQNGTTSDRLLQVSLPSVDMARCNQTYNGKLVGKQLCFGGTEGKDSCRGDSGGPLTVSRRTENRPPALIGVVSFGPLYCGQKVAPGVYASVPSYRDWIDENMRP